MASFASNPEIFELIASLGAAPPIGSTRGKMRLLIILGQEILELDKKDSDLMISSHLFLAPWLQLIFWEKTLQLVLTKSNPQIKNFYL